MWSVPNSHHQVHQIPMDTTLGLKAWYQLYRKKINLNPLELPAEKHPQPSKINHYAENQWHILYTLTFKEWLGSSLLNPESPKTACMIR